MSKKNSTPAATSTPTPTAGDQQLGPVAPEGQTSSLLGVVYDPTLGIIGHLRAALSSPTGITKDEMSTLLGQRFPDRDAYGMRTTVQIQLGRLQKKVGPITSIKVEGRGRVYGWAETLDVAGLTTPAPAVAVA